MDEMTELKAEAFDLLREKEETIARIEARLREIYAKIQELEAD